MPYDANAAAEKQIRRAQEATNDYIAGVKNPKRNPMQAAKARKAKMRANVVKAIDDGTWERGLDSISQDQWSTLAAEKGGRNFADGVERSRQDIIDFHGERSRQQAEVDAILNGMPADTLEQNIARMTVNARENAKRKRTRRRR